jgi:hypothetical protein
MPDRHQGVRSSLVIELAVSDSPQIERRPRNPEVSASLPDVPDPLGVIDDSLLSMGLSLFVGHTDLRDHLASCI